MYTVEDVLNFTTWDIAEKIIAARLAYYSPGDKESPLTDREYDLMVEQLTSRDPDHPILKQVGVKVQSGKKVELEYPMLSLDKVKTPEEFEKWYEKKGEPWVVIMPKLDGIALDLTYRWDNNDSAHLVQANTRGDGQFGEDVTAQVIAGGISGIPHSISRPSSGLVISDSCHEEDFHVYGEVVISRKSFELINIRQKALGQKQFVNTRNLANASISLQDLDELRTRQLQFMAYNLQPWPINMPQKFDLFDHWGFDRVWWSPGSRHAPETHYPPNFVRCRWKPESLVSQGFDCDGLVVSMAKYDRQIAEGATGHHPKWAVAVKLPDEELDVTVKELDWTVSKTGTITPQAIYNPVFLGGAELERCTLHNVQHVIAHHIGVGTVIRIKRSGGVIPKFLSVVRNPIRTTEWSNAELEAYLEEHPEDECIPGLGQPPSLYPARCPSCSEETHIKGVDLKCPNLSCPAQAAMRLEHFLSSIEFKGIGEKICDLITKHPRYENVADLWRLSAQDLSDIVGWRPDNAESVHDGLHEWKTQVPFDKMLVAFQIQHLGRTAAKKIAQEFESIEELFATVCSPTKSERSSWFGQELGPNVGPTVRFLLRTHGFELWNKLQEVGFKTIPVPRQKPGALKICITGKLSRGRDEYKKLIEGMGHEFAKSLSKDVDVLVVGENVGANKTAKAEKYGTSLQDENWLISLLGDQA